MIHAYEFASKSRAQPPQEIASTEAHQVEEGLMYSTIPEHDAFLRARMQQKRGHGPAPAPPTGASCTTAAQSVSFTADCSYELISGTGALHGVVPQLLAGAASRPALTAHDYAQLEEDSTDESDDDAIGAVEPENAGYVPLDTVRATWAMSTDRRQTSGRTPDGLGISSDEDDERFRHELGPMLDNAVRV